MKCSIVVMIIATTVVLSQIVEVTSAELSPYDLTLSDECAVQEGASAADIDMISTDEPISRAAKCYLACFYEKLDIIKNKKLDVDVAIEMTKNYNTDDPETLKIITKTLSDCTDVTDEDRCEAVHKIGVCVENAAKSHGLYVDR